MTSLLRFVAAATLVVAASATTALAQSFTIPPSPGVVSQQNLAVAYDANHEVYLVVCEDNWIQAGLGYLNLLDGVLVSPSTGTNRMIPNIANEQRYYGLEPWGAKLRVANINLRHSFVVVWQDELGALRARSVEAGTGTLSPKSRSLGFRVAAGVKTPGTNEWHNMFPDIGGDATGTSESAVVVWNTPTAIKATRLSVSSSGALSKSSDAVLATGNAQTINAPAISQSGGADGRYLVTWQLDREIRGLVIDRSLAVLASFSESSVATNSSQVSYREGERPAVDGNTEGNGWLLAYASQIPASVATSSDVLGRAVTFDPASSQLVVQPELALAGEPNRNEHQPTVAYTGGSYLVGYVIRGAIGAQRELHVKSVDPFTCAPCEGDFTLRIAKGVSLPAIVGELSGSLIPAGRREWAMMVWQEDTSNPNLIAAGRGMMIPADDGVVTSLGGGCGQGGNAQATCSITGNRGFALRLRHAAPSSMAWTILAATSLGAGVPCGLCALTPDPSTGFVVPGLATDALGNAALSFTIPANPSLVGQAFYQQWLVASGSGSCFGVDMSDALRVEIQ